jgi:hypothetical protein
MGAHGFRYWKARLLIFEGDVVVTEKLHIEDKDKKKHIGFVQQLKAREWVTTLLQ